MQVVLLFLVSVAIIAAAKLVRLRRGLSIVELAINATSTAIALGLGYIVQDAGGEWSFGISLFLVAVLTVGFSAFVRAPVPNE